MITPKITNLGYSNLRSEMSTILGYASLGYASTFDQQIQKLFANGEQGFFYDPNDLSTMFQNSAGTVPVTGAGQPVGLMLDKSKGLVRGSVNLFSNVNRKDKNWIDNGDGTFTSDGGTGFFGVVKSAAVPGKYYEWTFEVTSYTSGRVRPLNSMGVGYDFVTSAGTYNQKVVNNSSSLYFYGDSFGGTIRQISVRELFGNHAYQSSSARRPLLVASKQRLDYDTVDDKLITALPAQLTGCTVIRSVPNVGTQILTNQTIPATYNNNTDHCGLLVVNRALTPTETSAITAEFNKRAGV